MTMCAITKFIFLYYFLQYIAYKVQLEIKQFEVTLSSNRRQILKASLSEMLTSYENRPEGKGVR
jgi:hypothetical protein